MPPQTNEAYDTYGNNVLALSAPSPSNWNDIFISLASGYRISSMNTATPEFISFTEAEVENATGTYACCVSAMLNCAPHYIASFPWRNWAADYRELWSASNTYISGSKGSIDLGETEFTNIGPGFQSYCRNRGVSISYSYEKSPTFTHFKNMVDRGDMGIFGCGINVVNDKGEITRSGHGMAVEGYAILKKGTISEDINTLIVADGWYDAARYLSFYYTKFTDTHGIYFSS